MILLTCVWTTQPLGRTVRGIWRPTPMCFVSMILILLCQTLQDILNILKQWRPMTHAIGILWVIFLGALWLGICCWMFVQDIHITLIICLLSCYIMLSDAVSLIEFYINIIRNLHGFVTCKAPCRSGCMWREQKHWPLKSSPSLRASSRSSCAMGPIGSCRRSRYSSPWRKRKSSIKPGRNMARSLRRIYILRHFTSFYIIFPH